MATGVDGGAASGTVRGDEVDLGPERPPGREGAAAGAESAGDFDRAAIRGILVTALMRSILFLAILGVLAGGTQVLDPTNPARAAFRLGGGALGETFFGVVFWSAAITSVVGCSYTSLSFV